MDDLVAILGDGCTQKKGGEGRRRKDGEIE